MKHLFNMMSYHNIKKSCFICLALLLGEELGEVFEEKRLFN
ncbi:hypothetical protein HMPREF9148_01879 [Prevotella sp. F0091]|nr:hypothetical protein HMPREF9148_01879 [Prevotella sp. F0091]